MLSSFNVEMRKLLATSKAEFNLSVGEGMGSKRSWTKAAFEFGRERARRLKEPGTPKAIADKEVERVSVASEEAGFRQW